MLHLWLEEPIQRVLRQATHSPWYALVVAFLAFASAVSMLVPFTLILLPAVLLKPRVWQRLWLTCSAGSACGATLLVLLFHHLGWAQLYAHYPQLQDSASWQQIMHWMEIYGVPALALVAALPVAQTPALIFCSITAQPIAAVLLALFAGKIVKYGVVAFCTARFPQHFRRALNHGQ